MMKILTSIFTFFHNFHTSKRGIIATKIIPILCTLAIINVTQPVFAVSEDESRVMTETNKEALISNTTQSLVSTQSEAILLLGDPTNFRSPCVPLPATTTPHDGNDNDGGWQLVDFCTAGATGSGPASPPDCHHNDDDSASVALPFTFSLYGNDFTSAFINNNGNLSFGQLFSTFTATGFPVSGFPMVAPFWGDVDTGDQLDPDVLGHVWSQFISGNTLAVTWDNVGYYNEQGDKLNTFQVLISDGTNADMGIGNNVCLCYDDMQWTTGDASGGVGGFGGTPATVGANAGDGIDFIQIGQFDHAGVDYDGPFGNNDGVDYLDGRGAGSEAALCFNASGANVPPIPLGFPSGDTVTIQCNADPLDLTVQFLSPEAGQVTSVAVNDVNGAQAAGLVITNTPGNTASVNFNWSADPTDVGSYVMELTATDNFSPPGETLKTLTINIDCPPVPVVIDIKPGSDPNAINRSNGGVIPVAILGSNEIDVRQVNVSTLLFGKCGGEIVMPYHNPAGHYEDVNGDGFQDLVTHYKTRETNFATNETQACLVGSILDGTPIVGNDSVKIVK